MNIPMIVPGAFCDLCPPPAPGAIIIMRGTDHAMAPYPLRDQEGRQVGHLAALFQSSGPPGTFFRITVIYLTLADAGLWKSRVVRGCAERPRVPAGVLWATRGRRQTAPRLAWLVISDRPLPVPRSVPDSPVGLPQARPRQYCELVLSNISRLPLRGPPSFSWRPPRYHLQA